MSFLTAAGAVFHAIEGTRLSARLLGRPVEALEAVSENLRPIRAVVNQERAEEMGQQLGNVQQPAQPVSLAADADEGRGGNIPESAPLDGDAANESIIDTDDEGILESIADAIGWILDKL